LQYHAPAHGHCSRVLSVRRDVTGQPPGIRQRIIVHETNHLTSRFRDGTIPGAAESRLRFAYTAQPGPQRIRMALDDCLRRI
jgi:hypothetical protein